MGGHVSAKRLAVIGTAVLIAAGIGGCGGKDAKKRPAAKPSDVSVIYSSDLLGKIRSCGCAVKDMGGLGRWVTYLEEAKASRAEIIVVDAGDAFGAELSFSKDEATLAFEAMNLAGLDAFTPGETDFVFGLPFLQQLASSSNFDVIAANVVDETGQPVFGKKYKVKTLAGGLRIGIVGVLDDAIRFPSYIDASKFKVLPVEETLRKMLPELKEEADFIILLSHAGIARSAEIARQVPGFDLVVIGHERPIVKELKKEGESILLATGGAGQYLGRLDCRLSGTGEMIRGEMRLVPLEDTIAIHRGVKDLFTKYGLELTDKEQDRK